ncbi:MAG: hypothetical protein ACRDJW_17595 [Thermomicrobiales bacterium]
MDRVTSTTRFEIEVEDVMHKSGVDRAEAGVIVGNMQGDLTNDIDVVDSHPSNDVPQRRRTLREVMSELGELDDAES